MKAPWIILACLCASVLPGQAKTKIACVGDSITYGYTIANRETANYPYYLQQLLGDDYEVKNFGNSGKTAGDFPGQTGRWYGSTKEHQHALAFKPDIYICNLGINDTGAWWNPRLFVEGYETLIGQWRAGRSNAPVYMWTKLAPDFRGPAGAKGFPGNVFAPEFSFATRDNGSAANRPEAEKLLARIAAKHKAVAMDAYATLADHPEWFRDGLHPNAEGAKVIARFTCAALYRDRPWKQPSPHVTVNRKEQTVTLENKSNVTIVLDAAALATAEGEKKTCLYRFGTGSVLGPGETAVVRFKADKNSNDFVRMTVKTPCPRSVRFVPAPRKQSENRSRG